MKPSPSQLLKFAGVPAFLVTNPVNIGYLLGVPGMDHGQLLVTKSGMKLLVSVLEKEALSARIPKNVKLVDRKAFQEILEKSPSLGCEGMHISIHEWEQLKKKWKSASLIHKEGILEDFRRTKNAEEIASFKKSQRITQAILASVPQLLSHGVTELQVAAKLEYMAKEKGAQGMSFATIVAFGTHTSRPHHRPTRTKLKRGDLVQIDMGVKVHGYCSDQSRVFFTKEPTDHQQFVLGVLKNAKQAATKAVRVGAKTKEIDAIARDMLKKEKLDSFFIHGLGHGVGLDIHEGVSLSPRSDDILRKQEVITIEPGVYFEGKFGMRVEDEVIVG